MKAKATALLLADLGVTKSHSRPYTSNDNPFSETRFKTCKYQPGSRNARLHRRRQSLLPRFFHWYNTKHHHPGIGLMTPDQVHYGQANEIYDARKRPSKRLPHQPDRFSTSPRPLTSQPPSGSIRPKSSLKSKPEMTNQASTFARFSASASWLRP